MGNNSIQEVITVGGMTCSGCERRIEQALRDLPGIAEAEASFTKARVKIVFDPSITSLSQAEQAIIAQGYEVKPEKTLWNRLYRIGQGLVVLLALYLIVKNLGLLYFVPEISPSMGYGLLFVTGMLVSIHCIAMCGGINLSQAMTFGKQSDSSGQKGKIPLSRFKPSILYNAGRVTSYTLIGGLVGVLGSLVGFSGTTKGIVAIVSGAFMILVALNMLDLLGWLRRLVPRLPKSFAQIQGRNNFWGPYVVGLLNGLMPCGPLQAMQLYALGTGSFITGAMSMLFFSLGTVPLMAVFGVVASLLSHKFTQKMLKASAVLVLILGFVMVNRGLALSGVNAVSFFSPPSNVAKLQGEIQVVTTELEPGSYTPIVVQKGVPVRWTIKVDKNSLNGCNNPIVIPLYNLEIALVPGDNIVEFTPEEAGTIGYSCWMGMIRSSITVEESLADL